MIKLFSQHCDNMAVNLDSERLEPETHKPVCCPMCLGLQFRIIIVAAPVSIILAPNSSSAVTASMIQHSVLQTLLS